MGYICRDQTLPDLYHNPVLSNVIIHIFMLAMIMKYSWSCKICLDSISVLFTTILVSGNLFFAIRTLISTLRKTKQHNHYTEMPRLCMYINDQYFMQYTIIIMIYFNCVLCTNMFHRRCLDPSWTSVHCWPRVRNTLCLGMKLGFFALPDLILIWRLRYFNLP